MARLFNEQQLREIAKAKKTSVFDSSVQILESAAANFNKYKTYDIFLSHSFHDAEVIHGLKIFLEEKLKLSVYVDWIEDRQLDRTKVNRDTADTIRQRMKNCKSLVLASSENTPNSKWVPWEVGYFDGIKNRIAILPITKTLSYGEEYEGQEYLGLYSYSVYENNTNIGEVIWVQDNPKKYVLLTDWVNGKEPAERTA